MAPPQQRPLTKEDKDKIIKYLSDKGAAQAACPMCQNREWAIADSLVLHSLFLPDGGVLIGAGFPSVLLICTRCTNFRFHSAAGMDLLPKPQPVTTIQTKDVELKHG